MSYLPILDETRKVLNTSIKRRKSIMGIAKCISNNIWLSENIEDSGNILLHKIHKWFRTVKTPEICLHEHYASLLFKKKLHGIRHINMYETTYTDYKMASMYLSIMKDEDYNDCMNTIDREIHDDGREYYWERA